VCGDRLCLIDGQLVEQLARVGEHDRRVARSEPVDRTIEERGERRAPDRVEDPRVPQPRQASTSRVRSPLLHALEPQLGVTRGIPPSRSW
jgi:hypothetical protein